MVIWHRIKGLRKIWLQNEVSVRHCWKYSTFILVTKKKLLSVSISIFADSSHIGHIKHDYQNHKCEIQIHTILDRSLMIDWRENSGNFECVSSVFTFVCVCLSVCNRATEQTFWHRNLIFGLSDPCDMKKKRFFVFKNLHFYTFYWHFSIFPL